MSASLRVYFPDLTATVAYEQEDEELLKQTDLPVRRRLAVIVRLGEKRLLVGARAKLDADWPQGKAGPAAKEKKRSREGKEEGRKKKAKQQ